MTLRAAAVGVAVGFAWGVVARGSMRLMAATPEFTWSGTLSIVGVATVVGGLVAVVRQQRLAGRSWWWRLLGLPFILMFAGAGVILVPGVVGVVMLLDRRRRLRLPGAALVGVTLWAVAVEDLGLSMSARQWMGVAVMLGCLAVLGWAARELVRRWRPDAVAPRSRPAASDAHRQVADLSTGP
ncbi:MAG TPA: hypothetical protein VN257_03965 [Actinotalea sp.]|nr:hypothetical protein [Actinotalea sp.]